MAQPGEISKSGKTVKVVAVREEEPNEDEEDGTRYLEDHEHDYDDNVLPPPSRPKLPPCTGKKPEPRIHCSLDKLLDKVKS